MTPRLLSLQQRNNAVGRQMDAMRSRFQRIAERHTNGTAPQAVSAYQLFQTPVWLATRMAEMLGPCHRVLEPSAGLGRLLDAVQAVQAAQQVPGGSVTAVEQSPECARVLYNRNQESLKVIQCDFLTLNPGRLGAFEGIIANPPFHMRADIAHMEHALQFLAPWGTLVAVMMDTYHRANWARKHGATIESLPEDTFRESGTSTRAILVKIVKS